MPIRGSAIVGHATRDSFIDAVGGVSARNRVIERNRETVSAADCRRGLLAAWQEKYGGASDPPLATDAEIRACTRLASREVTQ